MVENIDQVEEDGDDGDGGMGDVNRWINSEFLYLSIDVGGQLCRWVVILVWTVERRGPGGDFWCCGGRRWFYVGSQQFFK